MKADNVRLLEFIGASKRTFYIPVYQRNYDWKKEHCETLFRDIEEIYADKDRSTHFMGTIVYTESGSTATFRSFTVIDGQQRLTTIMLLLKAIFDSTENEDLKADILESYLINPRSKTEELRIKLKPMKADAQNFKRLIDNQIDEMDETQIINNYRLFMTMIAESRFTPDEIFSGIEKLEIVYIELDQNQENPQLIFESLNSTGLDLTQADLIRNFLLMGQEYHKQEELYNRYWLKLEQMLPDTLISDYVRDYITLKTYSIPKKDSVYTSFKKYYREIKNYDSEGFLEELKTYGEYYSWFRFCNCPDVQINERLSHLQKLKSTVVYPFLLNIFEDYYMYEVIDVQEVCRTLDVILSYVMRRLLCEMPTNALNKVFATMAKDIKKYSDVTLHEQVAYVLASKTGKTVFPSDEMLQESLLSRDLYKFPHVKFVLEQIERTKSKETVDFSQVTIEHIMPQTLTSKWRIDLGRQAQNIYDKHLHSIGNLTLTGYNPELSNASFEEKCAIYKDSNISITKSIAENDKWGADEIMNRSQEMIKDIQEIWKYPDIIKTDKQSADSKTEFDIMDEIDVTGRTPVEIEILGESHTVNSWRSFMETLCKTLYEYDNQLFRSLVRHNDFRGKRIRAISDTDENMRAPLKIADGIFIETNRSANDILNYSKLIVEKFEGMEEVCSYKLKPQA